MGRGVKDGPSKICGRQPFKNLKWYGLPQQTISFQMFKRLSSTNFTRSILEYLDLNIQPNIMIKLNIITRNSKRYGSKLATFLEMKSIGSEVFFINHPIKPATIFPRSHPQTSQKINSRAEQQINKNRSIKNTQAPKKSNPFKKCWNCCHCNEE